MLTIQAHKCQIHSIGWDPETTSFACNLPGTDDNADEADDAGESYAEQHWGAVSWRDLVDSKLILIFSVKLFGSL